MDCQQDLDSVLKPEVSCIVLKTEHFEYEEEEHNVHFCNVTKTVMEVGEIAATIKNEDTEIKSEVKDERLISLKELEEGMYSSGEEDVDLDRSWHSESHSSYNDSDDSMETDEIWHSNIVEQGVIVDSILISDSDIPQTSFTDHGHRQDPLTNDLARTEGEQSSSLFNWKTNESYRPRIHAFEKSGGCLDTHVRENPSILDCFELFVSQDVLSKITLQTNLFLRQKERKFSEYLHNKQWIDIDESEFYCFIALSLLMPQVKKLKITDYWSTDAVIATPFFSQVMTRDRYISILSHLHFSDNCDSNHRNDKLYKIRLLLDHFTTAYKRVFYPFQNLCIDRSLTLPRGQLYFKQNSPSKQYSPSKKFGVRFLVISDCETGYILDFIVYCGASLDIVPGYDRAIGKSESIVCTLIRPYLDSGHTLYTSNWFTSPILYDMLHNRKTNACGVVKMSRKHMPEMGNRLSRGEIQHYETENLLALKWQGKCEVTMLSTCHTAEKVITGQKDRVTNEVVYKPNCIVQYNKNMGAIERTDNLQSAVESTRKSIKWYKNVFFHILDMSILNAHAVYKMKTGSNVPLGEYQLKLVKEILEKYHTAKPRSSYKRSREADSPVRLTERHFISQLPKKENSKRIRAVRCVVCSKHSQRKETCYQCEKCNVPLCVIPCFEKYHTVKHY